MPSPSSAGRRRPLAALVLLALGLLTLPLQADDLDPTPEQFAVLQDVVEALREDDPEALVALVDFERWHAEREARGFEPRSWADLDALDRLSLRQDAVEGWLSDDPDFLASARIWSVRGLADPDAGQGPVPERIHIQAVLDSNRDDRQRDLVLSLAPDLAVIGLLLGAPYVTGNNPEGREGLQPLSIEEARDAGIRWSADIDELDRDEARELVKLMLSADTRRDEQLYAEYLHRIPRAGVTALLERVADMSAEPEPDSSAQHLLLQTVSTITGRGTDFRAVARLDEDAGVVASRNAAEVAGWLRWHERHGASFVATPIEDPLDPTFQERVGFAEGVHLPRWGEAVAKAAAEGRGEGRGEGPSDEGSSGAGSATGAGRSSGVGSATGAGGSSGAGSSTGVGGSSGVGSSTGVGGSSGVGSSGAGSASGVGSSGTGSGSSGVGSSGADSGKPKVVLRDPVAHVDGPNPRTPGLTVLWGRSEVTVEELGDTLPSEVREVLDDWADEIVDLDLRVILTGHDEHVVLGLLDEIDKDADALLREAGAVLDDAWDILDPILPVTRGHAKKPVVALLFDQQASRDERFDELIDRLEQRKVLTASAAADQRDMPRGMTMRAEPMYLQPTWDMAGNAAAGDDEFRLLNEVAHKFAQCMATQRCGQLPTGLLWGLGHLVENTLFESVYQFNRSGFVAAGDHFDWPKQARRLLDKKGRKRGFDLIERVMAADETGGTREFSNLDNTLLVYAVLETMAHREELALRTLFEDLADLQREHDPFGLSGRYGGDPDATREALAARLGRVEIEQIISRMGSL